MAIMKTMLSLPYITDPTADVSTFRPYEGPYDWAGLAVDVATTNICTYPNNIFAWPIKSNVTVTTDQYANPYDGGVTIDRVVENTATSIHFVGDSVMGLSANTTYALSVYIVPDERTWAWVYFKDKDNTNHTLYVNLSTGAAGAASNLTASQYQISLLTNGTVRVTFILNSGSGVTTELFYIAPAVGDGVNNYTGDGASGLGVGFVQYEALSYPTSYVANSRSAGQYRLPASVFPSDRWKFVISVRGLGNTVTYSGRYLFDTGTFMSLSTFFSSTIRLRLAYNDSGTPTQEYSTSGTVTFTGNDTIELDFDGLYLRLYLNNSLLFTRTPTLDGEKSYFDLGCNGASGQINLPIAGYFIDYLGDPSIRMYAVSGSQPYDSVTDLLLVNSVVLPPMDRELTTNRSWAHGASLSPRIKLANESSPVKATRLSWSGLTEDEYNAVFDWIRLWQESPRKVTLTTLEDDGTTKSFSNKDLVIDSETINLDHKDNGEYDFSFSALIEEER